MVEGSHSKHTLRVHKEELKEIWKEVKASYAGCREELSNPKGKKEEAASNSKKKEEASSVSLTTLKETYNEGYSAYFCCIGKNGELTECDTSKCNIKSTDQLAHSFQDPACDIEVFS